MEAKKENQLDKDHLQTLDN